MTRIMQGVMSGRAIGGAAAAVALVAAYLLGSAGPLASTATAGGVSTVVDTDGRPICQTNVVQVPTVSFQGADKVVVGASDGTYYVVDRDGLALQVLVERRQPLFWR